MVGSGYTGWHAQTILKDNSTRDINATWYASTVGGSSVDVVQPPFTILPTRQEVNIGSATRGEITKQIEIGNVPFEVAVPMLTGWDLRYDFGDQEVLRLGVWLTDLEYEQPAFGSGGTLRYKVTSVLADDDQDPGYTFRHNVHMLGLDRRTGGFLERLLH
jgi:hypothetical protein